jgi:uncharacterized protein (TIGR01777 family)
MNPHEVESPQTAMITRRIILAGGSGFLGQILRDHFLKQDCEVVVLTRSPREAIRTHWPPSAGGEERAEGAPPINRGDCNKKSREVYWDGRSLGEWARELDGADVLLNLAGRSVNCRYHARNRKRMMDSRVDSTRVLGEAITKCVNPPKVWLNSSTATIYKHNFGTAWDEDGEIGATPEAQDAFSIEIAIAWEREFNAAKTPRTRKVALRSAMVLGHGANSVFPVLCRLGRFGLGGQMASGKQYVSWIHETDFCRALGWLIDRKEFTGPVNLATPNPVTNSEMMATVRKLCGVPFGLPATAWMLEVGAFFLRTETELIIKSRRVVPGRLLASGFQFRFKQIREAMADLLAST